ATLINWANTNSIEPHAVFQNSGNVISEANYGGSGMPHIVVVGPDHNIYFNGLDAAANDPAGVTNAINQALLVSGILQAAGSMFHLSVAVESKTASINFSLGESSIVNIEMLNEAGQLVATKALGKMPAGNNNAAFELDGIAAGVYFIRLKTENSSQTVKFSAVK
ncbi:MAG TPA: T9SS type A sorting domain-containing protein, partial [Bacteroidia bacterium]|nr:T9SS type A sorting domain-containing protein [Bacteroidia bacterium]